jgi:hypothetical protein
VEISLHSNSRVPFLELKIDIGNPYQLTIKDVIVSLFGVYPKIPIETRTVLFKELFLTFEEVLKEEHLQPLGKNLDPEFIPYIFGPFSFLVASEIGSLVYNNTIKKEGGKNDEKFTITEKGKILFETLKEKLARNHLFEEFLNMLSKLRKGWDKLGRQGMMNRMRRLYSEYFLFGIKDCSKKKKIVIELLKNNKDSDEIIPEVRDVYCQEGDRGDYSQDQQIPNNLAKDIIMMAEKNKLSSNQLEWEIVKMANEYRRVEIQNEGLIWAESYKE